MTKGNYSTQDEEFDEEPESEENNNTEPEVYEESNNDPLDNLDEQYWKVPKTFPLDFIMLTSTLFFILWYKLSLPFSAFILKNYAYLKSDYSLIILFYLLIAIPLVIYYLGLILRIIRKMWTSYSLTKLRVNLHIIRINISYLGLGMMIYALAFRVPILSLQPIIVAFIVMLFINIFLRSYDDLREEQEMFSKLGEKEPIPIHIYHIFVFIVVGLYFTFYYTIPSFKDFFDNLWMIISADFGFTPILILTLACSIIWFVFFFVIILITELYKRFKFRIDNWVMVIIFIGLFYLVSKIIIFNVAITLSEPNSSLATLGISGSSALLLNLVKRKLDKDYKIKQGLLQK